MVKNSKDIPRFVPRRVMLVGDPSSGKTHLACTFPKPLVIDFDAGVHRVAGRGLDFDYESFNVLSDNTARDSAEKVIRAMGKSGKYTTLVLDTLTTWCIAEAEDIVANKKGKSNPKMEGKLSMNDYGILADRMTTLLSLAISLYDIVVVTAHQQPFEDPVSGGLILQPMAMGKKFLSLLPGYMEEIWQCSGDHVGGQRTFKIRTAKDFMHPYVRTNIRDANGQYPPEIVEGWDYEAFAKFGGFQSQAIPVPPTPAPTPQTPESTGNQAQTDGNESSAPATGTGQVAQTPAPGPQKYTPPTTLSEAAKQEAVKTNVPVTETTVQSSAPIEQSPSQITTDVDGSQHSIPNPFPSIEEKMKGEKS